MRLGIVAIVAAAALSASLAGAAGQTAPATAPTGVAPASADAGSTGDPSKLVCRREEVTGSRLGGKRICQTQADWDAQERQSKLDVQHEQNRGALFSTPGG